MHEIIKFIYIGFQYCLHGFLLEKTFSVTYLKRHNRGFTLNYINKTYIYFVNIITV